MQGFKKSLSLRIAIPVITVTFTLGSFLYFFVLDTISDFAQTDIENDLKSISHRIYNICNVNYDSMLQSSPADDPTSQIITRALTLGQLEDFYRQENIQGFVFDAKQKKVIAKTALPEPPNTILSRSNKSNAVQPLQKGDIEHFSFHFDFSPWNWRIVIIKDEVEYSHLIGRVKKVYIATLALLVAATALLVFFLHRSIALPVSNIIEPLRHARKPSYKGIEVFEYLSDTIRVMMCSIKQSEQKFRSLVERTNDFVWEIDDDGKYTYASPSIEKIIGHPASDVMGKHLTQFYTDDSRKSMVAELEACRAGDTSFEKILNVCIHKDGRQVFLESSGVPILDDNGMISGFHGIDRDITKRLMAEKERKEYETQQQLQKLETLGTFAGGMAHDFNNLLSIITGNICLADMTKPQNEMAKKYLARASVAVDRAEELTGQLISFAKGGIPNRVICPTHDLIIEAANAAVKNSNTQCEFKIASDLSNIIADVMQIKRAIGNIVINAAESMDNHGIITITAHNSEIQTTSSVPRPLPEGFYVKIAIEDSGVGISSNDINKIFDPYFTTKQMGADKGIGLGLAVSFSIIQGHGGHLSVDSESGSGTVFTIVLPAQEELPSIEAAVTQKSHDEKIKIKKILLMDDEEMIREIAQSMLDSLGYQSCIAENGKDAIAIYQQEMESGAPCDLVILDLTVKDGMSGLETLRRLSKIDPEVRAIVSSGYSKDPAMIDYQKHGFSGTLPKPYSLNDLKSVIEAAGD